MNVFRIKVTAHAVERYQERLGGSLGPMGMAKRVQKSKATSINQRKRYRLELYEEQTEWRISGDAFFLVRYHSGKQGCTVVTVLAVDQARVEQKVIRNKKNRYKKLKPKPKKSR